MKQPDTGIFALIGNSPVKAHCAITGDMAGIIQSA